MTDDKIRELNKLSDDTQPEIVWKNLPKYSDRDRQIEKVVLDTYKQLSDLGATFYITTNMPDSPDLSEERSVHRIAPLVEKNSQSVEIYYMRGRHLMVNIYHYLCSVKFIDYLVSQGVLAIGEASKQRKAAREQEESK